MGWNIPPRACQRPRRILNSSAFCSDGPRSTPQSAGGPRRARDRSRSSGPAWSAERTARVQQVVAPRSDPAEFVGISQRRHRLPRRTTVPSGPVRPEDGGGPGCGRVRVASKARWPNSHTRRPRRGRPGPPRRPRRPSSSRCRSRSAGSSAWRSGRLSVLLDPAPGRLDADDGMRLRVHLVRWTVAVTPRSFRLSAIRSTRGTRSSWAPSGSGSSQTSGTSVSSRGKSRTTSTASRPVVENRPSSHSTSISGPGRTTQAEKRTGGEHKRSGRSRYRVPLAGPARLAARAGCSRCIPSRTLPFPHCVHVPTPENRSGTPPLR